MLDETLRLKALVPLVLRLALAAVFIYHGVDKVRGPENDLGAAWAHTQWRTQGLPPAEVLDKLDNLAPDTEEPTEQSKQIKRTKEKLREAYRHDHPTAPASLQFAITQMAVAWGEVICGVTLLLGLLTRVSALLMIIIQVGAIATVTWARGFSSGQGAGYEYNLIVIAACAALALAGGGLYSVDHYWKDYRQRRAATTPPAPVRV